MKITALEEYGLRCMLLLARKKNSKPVTLPEVSANENITIPYAGKLLMVLKNAELVESVRGRNGGYVLSRPAGEISLRDIFEALGEPVGSSSHCLRHTGNGEFCVHSDDCEIKGIWQAFGEYFREVTDRVSLADLAEGRIDKGSIFKPLNGKPELIGKNEN
ncbi:MAG: Rrf2 family transcriptional regulator [candidate division Zixibacteria bacterium]|nr:Rrf2 family transcriptional regulator [candidate division Zixibacteria bacterium]